MSSTRSETAFDLPLDSVFCLQFYLLLVHAVALQLLIVMDWDIAVSILMIVILIRHYQQTRSNLANMNYSRLTCLPETGWQLHDDHSEPLSVRVMLWHRFGRRWWMLRLQSGDGGTMSLMLCPDMLDESQLIVLKQCLLLHRKDPALNEMQ